MGTARMGPLIFSMALPAMVSMIINALYNIVDSIFVAQYSQSALAAVSLVFPLQTLVVAIGVGTGVGVNSLISRRLGEKRQLHADSAAEHGIALSIIGGIVFLVLGFGLSGVFVSAFGATEEVSVQAVQYSHIAVGLSIFVMISMMCEKVQQSTGNMIIPMLQGLTGAIVNIILDPLMIFGIGPFPEMGVTGAALATVIGQIFGMLIGLWGVFKHQKVLKLNMRKFKWRLQTVKDIYRVGLPGIVMQSITSVMTAGMNGILIGFSQTAVNVLAVYFKLQTFVFMPVFGLNQGALPVMGYNYGARNKKRLFGAYRIALGTAVAIMLLGFVLFQLFPEPMLMMFVDRTDAAAMQEMLDTGVPALKTISLSFVGAAFGIINSTVFQATARGLNSLIVSVCRQLVIILPAAWLLGRFVGLNAIWYSFPIAEIASFLISYLLLWREYQSELKYLGAGQEEAEA
ncbi:MAG TPA: MATE family efflux transporter [Candidatus Agathobaculum intestinigallinarum]|nr:MATE family efflux transporter [Candidatus Agathobaculum intestinigallinarum]